MFNSYDFANGLAGSMFFNEALIHVGIQIAAVGNRALKLNGLQIGAIKGTNNMRRIQI